MFDNDTRLLITISFDNDFDKYFDDALALFTGGDPTAIGFEWIEGVQEFPEGGYRSKTWEEVKNFLAETQIPAKIFANTDDASVQAIDVSKGARPPRGRAGAQTPGIEAAARRSGGLIRRAQRLVAGPRCPLGHGGHADHTVGDRAEWGHAIRRKSACRA